LRAAGKAPAVEEAPSVNRFRLGTFVLLVCLVGIAGCARGAQTTSSAVMPAGIVPDASVTGIFPSNGETCCWTAPDVRFPVSVAPGQHELVVSVYQPKAGPLVSHDQTVSLIAPDGRVSASRVVRSGTSATLTFPLNDSASRALIHLHMSDSFVPKQVGAGPDIRRLSLILSGIRVQ
jgi:hypothetical protein